MKILMTFPAELRDEIEKHLIGEKKIFDKGSRNAVMKMLNKTLKAVTRIPGEVDINAIDFSYAMTSSTTAELVIVTPVEGLYNPSWVANRLKKEFEKADPRIKCELVKNAGE